MKRIGIFGGTFDPVHNGHLRVARSAVEDLSLDILLVVPAAVSPFKTDRPATVLPYDRIGLLEKAFAGVPKVRVDMREIDRGGVSYTIDTVKDVASEHPGSEIFLVVGADSMQTLPQWRDYANLASLCTFKPYPRTPESSTEIRRRLLAGESIAGLVPAFLEKEYLV